MSRNTPEPASKPASKPAGKPAGKPASRGATVPLLVAAAAAVVLALVLFPPFGGDGDGSAAESRSDQAAEVVPDGSTSTDGGEGWEQLARRGVDDPMALGAEDAPVVMLSYSEFQCPFCGKFARDTEPALVEQYVDDGLLRIEWRDFPYLGEESMTAAQAGRAAAAQGAFWEFHDALYSDQPTPNSGTLTVDYLAGVAGDLGLNVDQFRDDMASAQTRQAIQTDFAEGQAIGVTGTPAFVINGVPVIGAQPLEVFQQTVEQAAADAAS